MTLRLLLACLAIACFVIVAALGFGWITGQWTDDIAGFLGAGLALHVLSQIIER